MPTDIFAEVDKVAKNSKIAARASWRGILSLNAPELGLGSVQYHLRAAKVHGDQKAIEYIKIDKESGKQVVAKEAPHLFSYQPGPNGERMNVKDIPSDEVKEKVRSENNDLVFARTERQYFVKDDLEATGKYTPVPATQVVDRQVEDGQIIEPFDRTSIIEVEKDGYV